MTEALLKILSSEPVLPALQEDSLLSSVKSYIEDVNQRVLLLHESGEDPVILSLFRSDSMDRLLAALYHLAERIYRRREPVRKIEFLLISQGGYGRRELCLHSDIDILFLYEGEAQNFVKFLNEAILQNLWDAGLEVGFAARTLKECKRLMEEDLTILTSLLDARTLAGDDRLGKKFYEMQGRYFSSQKNRERFIRLKREEIEERQEKYGGSVYLLEPNLKEGEGGLRDYHTLYWLARVAGGVTRPEDLASRGWLTREEFESLWNSLRFLWRVRNEIHRRSGRRSDQLTFDVQEPVARHLGFQDFPESLGVELFMQRYYSEAATVHRLMDKGIRRLLKPPPGLFPVNKVPLPSPDVRWVDGRLTVVDPDLFEKEPLYLLRIFGIAREVGGEIDDFTRERIEKNLDRIDDEFRKSTEACRIFRGLLRRPVGLGPVLIKMNELGVLGAFLPEFKKLHFRVQHDIYHVYTVDMHSLFAVRELGNLLQGDYAATHPTLSQLIKDIDRMDLLAFAILYHDIGKGEGRGHVSKGAPLIRRAGERLGFSPEEVATLEFLELSHLIMTHLAFRRDLEEQNLIIQFARAVQNMDLLNRLYVLTFCDVKAVSSEAMTDWKSSLLEYLYLKTREVIQKGAFTREKVSTLVPKVREEVFQLLGTEEDRVRGDEFFAIMPPRYLLATPPPVILRHIRLWERFSGDPIVFESRLLEREGLNEVTLLTWENKALFSQMTGLFAAHNVNILEAQLHLSTKGHALQVFKVSDAGGQAIADPELWKRIEADLREILQSRLRIENLVAEKFRPSLFKKKVAQIRPARVDIDNDVSAYYTVIDIYAQDRTGLLYQITSTLSSLGLYVDVSKISTKVDQVADTFYVKDIFGQKITPVERLKKIREVLMKVLEEEPTPGWKPPVL